MTTLARILKAQSRTVHSLKEFDARLAAVEEFMAEHGFRKEPPVSDGKATLRFIAKHWKVLLFGSGVIGMIAKGQMEISKLESLVKAMIQAW